MKFPQSLISITFSHTTNLQQTTLKTYWQIHGNILLIKVHLMKKVENIVAKGEIARSKQFLLSSQCFQKSSATEASKSFYMWERINGIEDDRLSSHLTSYLSCTCNMCFSILDHALVSIIKTPL